MRVTVSNEELHCILKANFESISNFFIPEINENEGVVKSLYLKKNINEADIPANTPTEAKNIYSLATFLSFMSFSTFNSDLFK